MAVKDTLRSKPDLDPYQLYKSYSIQTLLDELEAILRDTEELQAIQRDDVYKTNLIRTVRFLYMKYLSEKKESSIGAAVNSQRELLSDSSLRAVYALAG